MKSFVIREVWRKFCGREGKRSLLFEEGWEAVKGRFKLRLAR